MSQTSIMKPWDGDRGKEVRSFAHKTCYCLDLDLQTSEGVWDSIEGQTISQEWHLRKISNSMRHLSVAMEVY